MPKALRNCSPGKIYGTPFVSKGSLKLGNGFKVGSDFTVLELVLNIVSDLNHCTVR